MKHIFSLILLCLTACSMTPGYSCENEPQSTIPVYAHGSIIKEVNGVKVSAWSRGVLLVPGENTLLIKVDPTNYNSLAPQNTIYELEMTAVEGKEYIVTSKTGIGQICAWERNRITGQPDYSANAGCVKRR
ncbi:MAG: hypothetical protein ACOX2O_09315 [Bdellovibrionota bacterium]|jgi:hypothetical protein